MQRYFIQLSYDGTAYHGWQIQPNGISVQETVGKVLSIVAREAVAVTGAGRTDAGVHASFFVAHFDTGNQNLDNEKVLHSLNCLLPADIAVQRIYKVNPQAHARFDALSRTYKYYLVKTKDPFSRRYAAKEAKIPELERMNEAACKLFDYEDFTSFSRLGTDVKTNNCKVDLAEWVDEGSRFVFTIRADRFLRNMVRAIVGTILEVGFGKLSVDGFCKIIEARDRCSAGASVEAKGLFLADIGYPEELSKGLIRVANDVYQPIGH
jgi:tRNA pseudouridine38-40 synthase